MNNIPLAGTVWVASDIHLGPDAPGTVRAFHAFLDQASVQADALILCGDIFDAWIGDDFALSAPPEWLRDTLEKFKQVSARIPLWLGRGNRDFLIGHALTDHVGARLLPDLVRLDTDGGSVLLSHGDQYCTDDRSYQRFRRVVRCPAVQATFLALSLKIRRSIANWARQRSMSANDHKPSRIMDVSPQAIEQAFSGNTIATLVHGHTHRPATHILTVNGLERRRIVLPDWDYDHGTATRGGWLVINRQGCTLHLGPPAGYDTSVPA